MMTMRRLLAASLATLLAVAPAVAQTSPPGSAGASRGSATTGRGSATTGGVAGGLAGAMTPSTPGSATTVTGDDLRKGANSFTEAQARRRLEDNGYSQVSGLTKDGDGIWRGSAVKNGVPARVGVDFKGDISMN